MNYELGILSSVHWFSIARCNKRQAAFDIRGCFIELSPSSPTEMTPFMISSPTAVGSSVKIRLAFVANLVFSRARCRWSKWLSMAMKKIIAVGLGSFLCCLQTFAQASYDWVVPNAHIISIEASGMPSLVLFSTDGGAGSCPAGTFVRWTGKGADVATQQANTKSVYALLLAARLSGTPVQLYGVNAACEIRFIYLG